MISAILSGRFTDFLFRLMIVWLSRFLCDIVAERIVLLGFELILSNFLFDVSKVAGWSRKSLNSD